MNQFQQNTYGSSAPSNVRAHAVGFSERRRSSSRGLSLPNLQPTSTEQTNLPVDTGIWDDWQNAPSLVWDSGTSNETTPDLELDGFDWGSLLPTDMHETSVVPTDSFMELRDLPEGINLPPNSTVAQSQKFRQETQKEVMERNGVDIAALRKTTSGVLDTLFRSLTNAQEINKIDICTLLFSTKSLMGAVIDTFEASRNDLKGLNQGATFQNSAFDLLLKSYASTPAGDSQFIDGRTWDSAIQSSLPDCRRLKNSGHPIRRRCRPTSDQNELKKEPGRIYQCTFSCGQSFRRKADWRRHENKQFAPDRWICELPHEKPVRGRIQTHFSRKDKLQEHLRKIHDLSPVESRANLVSHETSLVSGSCGFCDVRFESNEERSKHVARHFEQGACMVEWHNGNECTTR